MRFQNEFTVTAPVEQTWTTLLDVERVATCLPGSTIEPAVDDGVYRGAMRVKVGPVAMRYQGTVRLVDVDEDGHSATFEAHGKEAGGSGAAAAVIRNTLTPEGGGTRVAVDTELKVTGRAAQFGRAIMQDIAGSMMEQFAGELERLIASGGVQTAAANGAPAAPEPAVPDVTPAPPTPAETAPAAAPPRPAAEQPRDADALEVGGAVGQALAKRALPAAAVLVALAAVVAAARSRRRPVVTLKVRL